MVKSGWPERDWPKSASSEGWGPKISRFFFSLPPQFLILFSLSLVFFVEFWWCLFKAPERSNVHVWALGLSCETRAAPPDQARRRSHNDSPRTPNVHISGPRRFKTTKIPREDTKTAKRWRGEEKARNFGPPTLRGPTLRGPTFSSGPPHPSGLHPSGLPQKGGEPMGKTLKH